MALKVSIFAMFVLSLVQWTAAQTVQRPQYLSALGDDAGATCCIGHETCYVSDNPPNHSCFYAIDNGGLQTWWQCVSRTCDIWPNTPCWDDAIKARHEMGWDGAYLACDYTPTRAQEVADQCCVGPDNCGVRDSQDDNVCIFKDFYSCVSSRCSTFDGNAKDCEKDANTAVHKRAHDCR